MTVKMFWDSLSSKDENPNHQRSFKNRLDKHLSRVMLVVWILTWGRTKDQLISRGSFCHISLQKLYEIL